MRARWGRHLAPAALLPLLACGSEAEPPLCGDGEVVVEGTLDGEEVSIARLDAVGYAFVNAFNGADGTLDIDFADGDRLAIEFERLVANGGEVSARGRVDFAASGGPSAGNCADDGYPSLLRMDDDGDGGTFRLTALRAGAEPCSGAAISGELRGCFRTQARP